MVPPNRYFVAMSQEPADRKLAAILSADVYGYSRLMGSDEDETFSRLTASRESMFRLITLHKGRVANTAGATVHVRRKK